MSLNPDLHRFLLQLERAQGEGQEWVSIADVAAIPNEQREIAVRSGMVKQKSFGNLAQYKILAAGYSALGDNAEFTIKQMRGQNIASLDAAEDTRVSPLDALIGIYADDDAAPVGARPVVPLAADPNTCIEDGCSEPRYNTPARKYNRCKAHQQAIWRGRENARRSAPKTQPHLIIVEPPIADDDTQPDFVLDLSVALDPVAPSMNTPVTIWPDTSQPSPLTRLLARTAIHSIILARRVKGLL